MNRFTARRRIKNKSEEIRPGLLPLGQHKATRDDLSGVIRTALTDSHPLVPARELLCRRSR